MSGPADPRKGEVRADCSERRILFLQGPLSPLFRMTGNHLRKFGCQVFRINFCAGDWMQWHGKECTSFKGSPRDWPDFIEDYLAVHGITDLVLHGDQRIYHRIAVEKALPLDIQIAVTELGALRPGWMTLERDGLSTLSRFPADPDAVRAVADRAGDVDLEPRFPSSFWLQTAPDVAYNLTNVFLKLLYPNYVRHTIYPPIEEYLRGASRLLREKRRTAEADRKIEALRQTGCSYFVLPIQLEGDFQLRRHSPYQSFSQVLEIVFRSFSESAPEDAHLVLKSHPLDVGFEDWSGVSNALALKYGLSARMHYFDGGGLSKPLEAAAGVVTLNSTAGLEALQAQVPVKTLVPAHYDMEGLTHQGDLSGFWNDPHRPDPLLLNAYIRALAATTQIRGSIHNREGVFVAAWNIADRIAKRELNPLGAFVEPPPRLEKARKLGVPL
ncbi:capsule biosynthesis protein [Roseibium marinum]|uniref:Capsular polysaccharide export protein n=1 Tax=Roseibium marinum TaxID=281252 RepID=A0A2S3UNN8_9HYPH|nr:capsular biosynthesis protein [Roseibium marinum]POF29190.1 capsular polysaccharide export protein [Roseibium marinum]